MIYLLVSVVAVVIIVAIAIRRLPYLRSARLGFEITSPRPFVSNPSFVAQLWQRLREFGQQLAGWSRRRIGNVPLRPKPRDLKYQEFRDPYESDGSEMSVSNLDNAEFGVPSYQRPKTFQPLTDETPHDFWHEEAHVAPLEIPSQGLITRRGEAQKIAHELMAHADTAFRKNDFKEAEKYYLQAATKDPENVRIYTRLGMIYLETKQYRDAVEAFRGALRFDDKLASRHYNLALAYYGKKDSKNAERSLREAVRLDPMNEKYRTALERIEAPDRTRAGGRV